MKRVTAVVKNEKGIHARPSAAIVQKAKEFKSDMLIYNRETNTTANAKSVLEVLMLVAGPNAVLDVEAHGPDEEEAANTVAEIINQFTVE